ncbi:MAG: tripartite tricarboxylate transporter permease, partial [Reyranella sp.]|nr:tripartite tricarboxylate transporter permease [Reyranella sp.]
MLDFKTLYLVAAVVTLSGAGAVLLTWYHHRDAPALRAWAAALLVGNLGAVIVRVAGPFSSIQSTLISNLLIIAGFAPPLTELAFKFGPAEYFSLMVLGLIGAVVLASGSIIKAVGMIILGLLIGLIGTDVNSGVARFSFNIPELIDGVNFNVIAMGVFGYGEIINNLSHSEEKREVYTGKIEGLFPTSTDLKRLTPAVLRGTAMGSMLGILPGGEALLSQLRARTIEADNTPRPGQVRV